MDSDLLVKQKITGEHKNHEEISFLLKKKQSQSLMANHVENFLAGAGAGFCSGLIIGPPEAVKVYQQIFKPPYPYSSINFYAKLLKMTPPFAFSLSGVCALELSVNKAIEERYGVTAGILSSALTGAAFLTPADHLIVRRLVKNEKPLEAINKLRSFHPTAPWAGFSMMFIREAVFISSVMKLGPFFGKKLEDRFGNSDNTTKESRMFWTGAGRMSTGLVTTFFSQPFDTLARDMQKRVDAGIDARALGNNLNSMPGKSILLETIKRKNIKDYYRGSFPRLGLSTVGGTLIGGFFEFFKGDSKKNNFKDEYTEEKSNRVKHS